jgi:hypothetical protein
VGTVDEIDDDPAAREPTADMIARGAVDPISKDMPTLELETGAI